MVRAAPAVHVPELRRAGRVELMLLALLAITSKTGARLAEVGFLLLLIAGVWLVAAEVPQLKLARTRSIVAGVLIAVGGLLLIIATHWGNFG
jgi:hypothetical protein